MHYEQKWRVLLVVPTAVTLSYPLSDLVHVLGQQVVHTHQVSPPELLLRSTGRGLLLLAERQEQQRVKNCSYPDRLKL